MMQPKIQVRVLATGEIKAMSHRDARLMIACKKAEYVSTDAAQSYETKVMTAEPKRRGRPPKNREL